MSDIEQDLHNMSFVEKPEVSMIKTIIILIIIIQLHRPHRAHSVLG